MLLKTKTGVELWGNRNLDSLVEQILANLKKDNIISIGDSHSRFFSDLNKITVCHLGPVTAYNLKKLNSKTNGREKLWQLLDNTNPSHTALILSFGEIDVRAHVIKAAVKEKITIERSAINTAKNYCSVISEILDRGFSVLVHGVHASPPTYGNFEYPALGSVQDRNYAVKAFNNYVRNFSALERIPYASIDEIVINSDLSTRVEYMVDGCHLNFNAELQGIVLSAFVRESSALNQSIPIGNPSLVGLSEVSRNKPYFLTSSIDGKQSGFVSSQVPFFFHTNLGEHQGIVIDLQAKFCLDSVEIVNRTDCCQDRAKSLWVLLFDLNARVYSAPIPDGNLFLVDGGSTSIKFSEPIWASRVAVLSTANTYLHFSDVKIWSHNPPMSLP